MTAKPITARELEHYVLAAKPITVRELKHYVMAAMVFGPKTQKINYNKVAIFLNSLNKKPADEFVTDELLDELDQIVKKFMT